jgi:hypothetical protein
MSEIRLTVPILSQLEPEFDFIKNSRYKGIEGIWFVDSGMPGPILGITIQTHGNEPSGLAVLWHFRHQYDIAKNLQRGSIFFIINNIKATEVYLSALKMDEGENKETAKRKARFVDCNMNRLPEETLALTGDNRYEVRRAQELGPVWQKLEVAIDIHSALQKFPPTLVVCGELQSTLIKNFPIKYILTNIANVQLGKGAIQFYGEPGKIKGLGIEAGSHEDSSSFECAVGCVMALLRNLEMIAEKESADAPPRTCEEYFIDGSVLFPYPSFELAKVFESFERISEGQILAKGNGTNITAGFDGHALFGPKKLKPDSIAEEVLFLSRPMREIVI